MITEEEFQERFGFEPKQDDLHRVNCDKAGKIGHLMCGVCSQCGKPRFVCGCPLLSPSDALLIANDLTRIGNEIFALPDKHGGLPVVRVIKPVDALRLGVEADPNSVFIVRERALSDFAYKAIIEESGVGDMLYCPLTDETVYEIKGRINNCIVAAVCSGDLFKDLTGVWQWA